MTHSPLPFSLGSSPLPLLIEPGEISTQDRLVEWLNANSGWVREQLLKHGAMLFRGFGVKNVDDVETVARAIDPDLKNEYLGTSPRQALSRSGYVFSASELPGFYPIPAHNEMSFTSNPPNHIFFACTIAPEKFGETPLVDFRGVWRDLDPALRERWTTKGLRIIRNYAGPDHQGKDLFQLKKWTEIFNTTDRAEIERICAREGFTAQWKSGGRLALISEHAPVHAHPKTGVPVWFNHIQVFHLDAGHTEYFRIFRKRPTLTHLRFWLLARALSAWKHLTVKPEDQAMHATFADGSPIPAADLTQVFDAIWKNMVITPWRLGDIVAIDNRSIGHGRLPFKGPREIVVAWS
ncbi:MAG: TauD/TfdA family dioxygenase [Pseudomonadota bacterium]|nr:TauD/TfdA family dioxygenase [Pseudomonadota bacterium]